MTNTTLELDSVLNIVKREPAFMSSGDFDGWLSILAESAVYMPPNTPSKEGKVLRDWLKEFILSARVEWLDYVDGYTEISGNLAFHDYSYKWRVSPKNGSTPIIGRGKGIQILSRFPDGSWKIVRNIWNSNPDS
jgi:ketosteroid isomerase-like protein